MYYQWKELEQTIPTIPILNILIHQIANKHIKTYYYSCMVKQGQLSGPSLFHCVQC